MEIRIVDESKKEREKGIRNVIFIMTMLTSPN